MLLVPRLDEIGVLASDALQFASPAWSDFLGCDMTQHLGAFLGVGAAQGPRGWPAAPTIADLVAFRRCSLAAPFACALLSSVGKHLPSAHRRRGCALGRAAECCRFAPSDRERTKNALGAPLNALEACFRPEPAT